MMKNDLFKEIDDMEIDKISQDFPVLTDEEKDRIFSMSERKYNLSRTPDENEGFGDETVVTGVERYKRSIWKNYASIAAAALLMIGGISGSIMLMRNGEHMIPGTDTTETNTENGITKDQDKTYPEGSREAIAMDLSDRFAELVNKLEGKIDYDPSDVLEFNIYSFKDPSYREGLCHFARVSDPDFQTPDDYVRAIREVCTDEFYNRLEVDGAHESDGINYNPGINVKPSDNFIIDFSQYENGSDIDMASYNFHKEAYIIYKDSLYVRTDNLPDNWRSHDDMPIVTESEEDSFRAVRYALFSPVCDNPYSKIGTMLTYCCVKENGIWKIDNIINGGNIEKLGAYAISFYLNNKDTDLDDLNINENIIIKDVEITRHDFNSSFTVHSVLRDASGDPVFDFTADAEPVLPDGKPDENGHIMNIHIDFAEDFNFSNVDIKEIK